MFFVSDVPNNGQNVLDIMVSKPNRERQKLMREQNILKQVPVPTSGTCSSRPGARGRVVGHRVPFQYKFAFSRLPRAAISLLFLIYPPFNKKSIYWALTMCQALPSVPYMYWLI